MANTSILDRYTAKFGAPPKQYVIEDKLMEKSLRTGRDEYADLRKFLADVTKRRLQTRKKNAPYYAARRKQHREWSELVDAYFEKFGVIGVFEYSPTYIKLVKRALRTGKDQPELIAMRKQIERHERAYAKRRTKEEAAKLVYVFTADDEKQYTGYIKKRKLWEGACDLNWPKYRDYRIAHKGEVERLNKIDLRYVGQWTGALEK